MLSHRGGSEVAMKKLLIKSVLFLTLILSLFLVSACAKKEAGIKNTIEGSRKTYYEMTDGTFKCDEYTYKYRLEISGRMPSAAKDSTFVYLSNKEDISFEQAWRAAGFSSLSTDYFSPEDAVLVDDFLGSKLNYVYTFYAFMLYCSYS